MNKTELIAAVAESAGLSKKDTERVINAALDSITTASWEMLPLHVEFQGARVISAE